MDDGYLILNEDDVEEYFEHNELDLDGYDEMEMVDDEPNADDAKCVFTKHTDSVFCAALSNDAKLAATGGEDDKAFVWNTATGDVMLECTGFKDSVIFANFNHENTLLATGDMSGIIQVWRISDQNLVWDFQISDITWMQWHKAANVLFAASVKGEIYMWKIPDGHCKVLQSLQQRVETALVLPDGKQIAVGYESGTIRIVDLKTCSVLHNISAESGHSGPITAMDCHPNNNLIISASVDGTTVLSTSQTGKVVSVLQRLKRRGGESSSQEHTDMEDDSEGNWVETVSFNEDPQKSIAATGTVNGEIFIWDVSKQIIRHTITQQYGITKLIWKKGTTLIYSVGLHGTFLCYNGWTGEQIRSFLGHSADILDLCISRDGKIMLTTSDDCTARIFEIENC